MTKYEKSHAHEAKYGKRRDFYSSVIVTRRVSFQIVSSFLQVFNSLMNIFVKSVSN
jgi:hypothetical protein